MHPLCGLYSIEYKEVTFHGYQECILWTKATITRGDLSPDSFVLMLRYCENLKAIRYESTSLNRIVADKLHGAIVA